MDWAKAIAINQAALIRIVAALIAMAGLGGEGVRLRLERPTYRAVLRVLRPAEAAVRRLIVLAAQGLKAKLPPSRPFPQGLALAGTRDGHVSFQLFDARTVWPGAEEVSLRHGGTARFHLWIRSARSIVSAPACRDCRARARAGTGWHGRSAASRSAASGDQAGARRPAAASQASRALASQAGQGGGCRVHLTLAPRPPARLP